MLPSGGQPVVGVIAMALLRCRCRLPSLPRFRELLAENPRESQDRQDATLANAVSRDANNVTRAAYTASS